MKKIFLYPMIILSLIFCLSGCVREMYEPEEVEMAAGKGAEMMQSWLDENMPDAALGECTAVTAWTYYDHKDYLTDYVSGQISQNGSPKTFNINTLTGEVYFEMDADTRQELTEITEGYFYEALETVGIIPESVQEGYTLLCYVMAPVGEGDSAKEVPWVCFMDCGLPAGVEDLATFVHNPQSRLPIYIESPEITVTDMIDLSGYDLSVMEKLEEEYGLHIGSLSIRNSDQIFSKSDSKGQIQVQLLEHGNWFETDGFELNGWVRKRQEFRDIKTNEVTVSDQKVDPQKDIVVEQTDYGYRFSLLNKEVDDTLTLRAHEGAEILNYVYYCLDEEEYSAQKDPSEEGVETFWEEYEGGWYLLTRSSNGNSVMICDGDVLVRK